MNNPEKLTILGMQDAGGRKKTPKKTTHTATIASKKVRHKHHR
jgi:hypothetical protein